MAQKGYIPPQGLELEKTKIKKKGRGEVICAPRAQHGRVPVYDFS